MDNNELVQLRRKVKCLQKKPQSVQRTPEWYRDRQTRITASEAASCLNKSSKVCENYVKAFNVPNFKYKENEGLNPYESKDDYIIKKCSSFHDMQRDSFKDTVFTLWGKKYEDIASRLYSKIMNTRVIEFGLICHSRLKWLAASPDGITPDGIMLEIKCPKSRKIDENAPPLYYYIQCQIQLECCNLEMCDFLECEISEIDTEEEWLKTVIPSDVKQDKGIMLNIRDTHQYVYPPLELTSDFDYISWKNEQMLQNSDIYIPVYYHITKYNIIKIKRDREWFEAVKKDIKTVWELITKLQGNKDDFLKYKESIDILKNKAYNLRYETTQCLIQNDNSTYIEDKVVDLESTDCLIPSEN